MVRKTFESLNKVVLDTPFSTGCIFTQNVPLCLCFDSDTLNMDLVREACQMLSGTYDYSKFTTPTSLQEQPWLNPVKTISIQVCIPTCLQEQPWIQPVKTISMYPYLPAGTTLDQPCQNHLYPGMYPYLPAGTTLDQPCQNHLYPGMYPYLPAGTTLDPAC